MQSKVQHGYKPQIIKYMAMFMGICYLMNPMQHQINTVMHSIVHKLTPPASILSHHSAHGQFEEHQSPDHYAPNLDHDHQIIDLVNTIFEASNEEENSNDPNYIDTKWDKHISSTRFVVSSPQRIVVLKVFWKTKSHLINGHSKEKEEPPQKNLS